MASYNRVILMGRLTSDPKSALLPSGSAVCDFALAVNRQWKDAQGQAQEEVLFIDCVAYGKTAEAIGTHLKKGRPIHVEGRLKLDTWDQEGVRRSKIRAIVEQFRFIDGKPTENPPAAQGNGPSKRRATAKASTNTKPAEPVGVGEEAPF